LLDTTAKYKPHILATYLYELAQEFNNFYTNVAKILEDENKLRKNARLTIIKKITEVLKTGFKILGMEMPNEM